MRSAGYVGRVWGAGKVHTGLWWGDLMKRGNTEDLGVNGRILKWIFKWDEEAWTGFLWLRIGADGGHL
jgi:hypothetical protein